MPCRDNDYDTRYNKSDIDAAVYKVRQELEPLLCEACSVLEEKNALIDVSPELVEWYHKHEECEKHRVAYEAALKLTDRERRLLGIDLAALKAKAAVEKSKKK